MAKAGNSFRSADGKILEAHKGTRASLQKSDTLKRHSFTHDRMYTKHNYTYPAFMSATYDQWAIVWPAPSFNPYNFSSRIGSNKK